MNSIGEECQAAKKQYDDCFNTWFSEKFLRGHTEEDPRCLELFRGYSECAKKAIADKGIDLKDIRKDILGTDQEPTMPKGKS